jgi:hypothetical protein
VQAVLTWASAHALWAVVAVLVAVAVMSLLWQAASRLVRRVAGKVQAEDALTVVAAGLATTVAATGMFKFFGAVLHYDGAERALLFSILEVAALTAAARARRNMRDFGSVGVEGAAMWVLAALSGALASMAATSVAEAAFRLAAPMVAAWLWHRGLALERRRRNLAGGIHWRFTLERALVRLGLAEPTGRAVGEVAAIRRLTLLARAAKRVRSLKTRDVTGWRLDRAVRRLEIAAERANEFTRLATDPAVREQLLSQIDVLYGALELADLRSRSPWEREAEVPPAAALATRPAPAPAPAAAAPAASAVTPVGTEGGSGSRIPPAAATRPGGMPPAPSPAPTQRPPRRRAARAEDVAASLAEALKIVRAEPEISGADLGRRLGKCERQGRNLKTQAQAMIAELEGLEVPR